MFIPKNEQGVIYLFSRYHEELGFEKILHIGTRFPDITAIRNGEEIKIELEFLLSGFQSHYIIEDAHPHSQKWVKEKEDENEVYWQLHQRRTTDPTSQNYNIWFKTTRGISMSIEITKNIETWGGALAWRSLKPFCDIVVCWEANCELDDPDIEIIELKTSPSLL